MMKRRPIDTSASRLTRGVRLCPAKNMVGCVGMTRKAKRNDGQTKKKGQNDGRGKGQWTSRTTVVQS
jgi:hypothetical protein